MWFTRLALPISIIAFVALASAQTQIQPGRDIRWPATCQANMLYAPFDNTCTSPAPWVDPTSPRFGAKCDNITDDSAAFQAAINAIPSSGGTLLVPGYCVVTNLVIPASLINDGSSFSLGLWIKGAGRNYSQLVNKSTNQPTISATCASGVMCWNLTISDLTLIAGPDYNAWQLTTQNVSGLHLRSTSINSTDTTSGHTCGIYLKGQVGVTFTFNDTTDDVNLTGCSIVYDGIDDSAIRGGMMYPVNGGGTTSGRNYAISLINPNNIQISGIHDIGIPVGPVSGNCAGILVQGPALAVRIDGNWFDTSTTAPSLCEGILFLGTANATNIVNNGFSTSTGSAIQFQGAINNTIISDNQFFNSGRGINNAGGRAQVTFGAASQNGTIAHNKFQQTFTLTSPAITVSESVPSTNVYVGNTVSGAGFSATPWSGVNGAVFAPLAGVSVAGQAACIKSAGPPPTIGYCTNVVGAGGTCTCN